MNLQDALFNWLQIRIVADARPDDRAAADTAQFFEQVLREDHRLAAFEVERADDTMYHIRYETHEGKSKRQLFARELTDQLLHDIAANPKYNS